MMNTNGEMQGRPPEFVSLQSQTHRLDGTSLHTSNLSGTELPPHLERLIKERLELNSKLKALTSMLSGAQPSFISDSQWNLLHQQENLMMPYADILLTRINDLIKDL